MRKSDIPIDSRFYVPPNIVDISQGEYDIDDEFTNGPVDQTSTPGSGSDKLPTPDVDFTVVSQSLRPGPDGRFVVDVVIEFPDNYNKEVEMRYTKVAN